jgi:malonate-semialdehyde dehydrogenase (acetylating)/methylmalonate-semialdehyde dehydrogenase
MALSPLAAAQGAPKICQNLVGGTWRAASGAPTLEVRSPWNGAVIGKVAETSATEVDEIVRAAAAAFPGWRATPVKERVQYLFKFRELVLGKLDLLASQAAAEAGKTTQEARAGVLKGVEVLEFALSVPNLEDNAVLEVSRGVTCQISREPLGVVCGITPFNFPAMVPAWMYPIAIALGNCFILKPSEKVPLTSQVIGELWREAGLPAGVFSIANGGAATAGALLDHPGVAAAAFVGSTPAALAVYRRATEKGKRCLALGGAKNPLIVVPDADPDLTVQGVVDSFTGCAGQRCMAASLMIAVGDVETIIDQVVDKAAKIPLGIQMGAIIDKAAKARIESAIEAAAKAGATIRLDGRSPKTPVGADGGNWLGATVIDHCKPEMECVKTEIFGPVLSIVRVKTLSEALKLEAASTFGNATSVFTTSGAVAREVASSATSGMVGVNIGVPVPREPFSFGGTKQSKFGALDITGTGGVEFWSERKKVTIKWAAAADRNWMS